MTFALSPLNGSTEGFDILQAARVDDEGLSRDGQVFVYGSDQLIGRGSVQVAQELQVKIIVVAMNKNLKARFHDSYLPKERVLGFDKSGSGHIERCYSRKEV